MRLAVRGILVHEDRLLLVNAYADHRRELWCAPGGGVERHSSLPDNLKREIYEETGLTVQVGEPALVNEFHDKSLGFHQVDLFFRCHLQDGQLVDSWVDPENVVNKRGFFSKQDVEKMVVKPSSLVDVAWGDGTLRYDPLEQLMK